MESVERALLMVELVGNRGPLTVSDLGRRLDVSKSMAYRTAQTLVAREWLVKNVDRTYALGPRVQGLATSAGVGQQLIGDLRPIIEEVYEATGETVHLTRLDGRHILYLDQIASDKPVRSVAVVGSRSPAHCVSPGLAQLARVSTTQLEWFLTARLRQYTPASITRPRDLRAELARVRDRGYGINRGGYRPDIGGVGVAVMDAQGVVPVVGLSVCCPLYRLTAHDISDWGALLGEMAEKASHVVARAGTFAQQAARTGPDSTAGFPLESSSA